MSDKPIPFDGPEWGNARNAEWLADYSKHTNQRATSAGDKGMNINDAFPSKYLKAADLKGAKVKATISRVESEDIGDDKSKPVVYFVGKEKGLVLNKTNAMIIASQLGPETAAWHNQEIYVYPGKTQFNGQMVDCLKVEPVLREAGSDDDVGF